MMPNHTFTYSARELRQPLNALCDWLAKQLDTIAQELLALDGQVKATPALSPLAMAMTPAEQSMQENLKKLGDAKRKQVSLLSQKRRAWLWLQECRRSGRGKFTLDEAELQWLYAYKEIP